MQSYYCNSIHSHTWVIMHTYSSETLVAGEAWELGYCVCLIAANQNGCIFIRCNQMQFSFSYHRLAYAAEYKKLKLNLS